MRVPHTIDHNTLLAYGPSEEARAARGEEGRVLRAEDVDWDAGLVPTLSTLCTLSLPAALTPLLPCPAKDLMVETLPTNLPLPLATKVIQDGIYWKRRTEERWKSANNVQDAGGSWKQYYMEKHTQEVVEELTPEGYVEEELDELCQLVSDFVRRLDLRELQVERRFLDPCAEGSDLDEPRDRINLQPLVSGLTNLVEMHIQFSMRNIGSNYRKVLLQFTAQDCRNLGQGVAEASSLRLLRVHHSALDDSKLMTLLSQMQGNSSLEALAFPHCRIGDEGAAALARFLSERPKLRKLDISNNFVGKSGVQALAFALTQQNGCGLTDLNLALNGFGDEGAQFLLSALQRKAPALRLLNVSCAGLGGDSGILLGELLACNSCLADLDVSNNNLGAASGPSILRGMKSNLSLQFLDLRMTGVADEVHLQLETLLHANRCRDKQDASDDEAFLPEGEDS